MSEQTTDTSPIRVLCVDDHAFLVEGLRARLDVEPDMEYAGRLESADDLVTEVKNSKADIVLLDIEMPGADVFESIYELRRRCPDVRTILLSAHVRVSSRQQAAVMKSHWAVKPSQSERFARLRASHGGRGRLPSRSRS